MNYSVQELKEISSAHVMRVWDHTGLILTEGKGVIVKDVEGKEYIDCTAQAWTQNVGFCHPKVIKAVTEQAKKLVQAFPTVDNIPMLILTKKLMEITPPEFTKVTYALSGSDAIEGALRLAMRYTGGQDFVTLYHGYHGRSFVATSMTYTYPTFVECKKGVERFMVKPIRVPNFYCYRCYFDRKFPECDLFCAKFLEEAMKHASDSKVAGVLLEPIQGNGGQIVPPPGYLKSVRKICTKYDVPLIYDEIQTGAGRCGKMFAAEVFDAFPDILVIGKGFGSGFPFSAIITSEKFDLFKPGDFGFTNSGNPVSCAAALATIEVLLEENLLENAVKMGEMFMRHFQELSKEYPWIGEVRGKGLFLGVEIIKDPETRKPDIIRATSIVEEALKRGVIIAKNAVGPFGNVLKIKPPLSIKEAEVDQVLSVFEDIFKEMKERSE